MEISCDLKESQAPLRWNEQDIYYWVDGLHVQTGLISSRGTLAVLLKHRQTEQQYIDKVVLSNARDDLLAARYFTPDDKMHSGNYLPYLIFDNIDLKSHLPLSINIQQVSPEGTRRYRYQLPKSDLRRSRLDQGRLYLPGRMAYDLTTSHQGYVSGLFRFRKSIPFDNFGYHLVKARVMYLAEGGSFSLQVLLPHTDGGPDHYFRYFVATDPVGRILGITERAYNGSNDGVITTLTEDQRNALGLIRDDVANINDCPYVMVFTEDIKEGLVQGNVWLR